MISPSSALALIAPGDSMDITQVHAELSWIESRALDAGNSQGDSMAGPLTVPGLVLGGASVSTNALFYFGTDIGPANSLTVTTSFPSALAKGQVIAVKVANTNTGSTTLNINSLGANTIRQGGVQLSGGELPANGWVLLEFDGTYWNVIGMAPGGSPNVDVKMYAFPSGTRMLFQQATVPPGWTQDTTVQNDSLLRVVDGAGGGVYAGSGVSSVLRGGSTSDGTAISVAQLPGYNLPVTDPGHQHTDYLAEGAWGGGGGIPGLAGLVTYSGASIQGGVTAENWMSVNGTGISVSSGGGGAAHTHTLSALNVNSIDIIVGVKN
ncbi:MAG: hypothetical protein ACYCR5_04495 [Leptospirillum sp.]